MFEKQIFTPEYKRSPGSHGLLANLLTVCA